MRILSGLLTAVVTGLARFVGMLCIIAVWILTFLLSALMVGYLGVALFCLAGGYFLHMHQKYAVGFGMLGYSAAAFVGITVLHYVMGELRDGSLLRRHQRISLDKVGGLRLASDATFHDQHRA